MSNCNWRDDSVFWYLFFLCFLILWSYLFLVSKEHVFAGNRLQTSNFWWFVWIYSQKLPEIAKNHQKPRKLKLVFLVKFLPNAHLRPYNTCSDVIWHRIWNQLWISYGKMYFRYQKNITLSYLNSKKERIRLKKGRCLCICSLKISFY